MASLADVIPMIAQVVLVADEVLPKPPLPDRAFVAVIRSDVDMPRYGLFDLLPSSREIMISFG